MYKDITTIPDLNLGEKLSKRAKRLHVELEYNNGKPESGKMPGIENINDSMELDTTGGAVVWADGRINGLKFEADVRVCGDVRVIFRDKVYRCASKMPAELLKAYHDRTNPEKVALSDGKEYETPYYCQHNNRLEKNLKIFAADGKILYDNYDIIDDPGNIEALIGDIIGLYEDKENLSPFRDTESLCRTIFNNERDKAQIQTENILDFLQEQGVIEGYDVELLDCIFSGKEPHKPKKKTTKLEKVREELIGKIKKALGVLNIDSFDLMDYEVEGAPIIFEDEYDDNNTFTLDRVQICKNGNLLVEANSCGSSCTVAQDRIPTDALADIAEMFEDNLDDFLQHLIEDKCADSDISDAESFLWNHFGECAFSDEKIDDGLDENPEGDKYLMMRSYNLPGGAHVRLYFGDNSKTVTCVEADIANCK